MASQQNPSSPPPQVVYPKPSHADRLPTYFKGDNVDELIGEKFTSTMIKIKPLQFANIHPPKGKEVYAQMTKYISFHPMGKILCSAPLWCFRTISVSSGLQAKFVPPRQVVLVLLVLLIISLLEWPLPCLDSKMFLI